MKIAGREATKISEELTTYESAFRKFVMLQKKIGRTDEEGLQGQFKEVIERMETVVGRIMTKSKSDYDREKVDFRFTSLII